MIIMSIIFYIAPKGFHHCRGYPYICPICLFAGYLNVKPLRNKHSRHHERTQKLGTAAYIYMDNRGLISRIAGSCIHKSGILCIIRTAVLIRHTMTAASSHLHWQMSPLTEIFKFGS